MKSSGRSKAAPRLLTVAASIATLALALPSIYLVIRNFTADADPFGLIGTDRVRGPLWRTISLAVLVSASTAVLGTAMAWLTTRTNLPFRKLFGVLLVLPLVYPTFIGAAALVRTLGPGGLLSDLFGFNTPSITGLTGAWLVLTLLTFPYVYLPVAARLSRLPSSIEQSARLLGDSMASVLFRVILPQVSGSIGAGVLLVFLYAISDFGAVSILRYDTLTRAIENNQLANRPVALALSLVLLILAAIVVLFERRLNARSTVPNVTRSQARSAPIQLGATRPLAFAAVLATIALSVGAPLAALLNWSIRGLITANDTGRRIVVDTGDVAEVTSNTLGVSVIAALISVAVVLPIALLVGRYRSAIGTVGHAVAISTFALPGILIALAGTFFIRQTDWTFDTFNNSMAILIFAYIVRFAALAMGTVLVAVLAVPARLRDASQTLGATERQRFVNVDLPLMTPGLLAAAGLVLLSTMKELPISLLLSPFEFETLATRIFSTFSEAFVTEAGIMALTLVVLSFVATWALIIRPLAKSR